MIIELISQGKPVRIPASQVVIYTDDGTPVSLAGEYGPAGAYKVSHVLDEDFEAALRAFGVGRHRLEVHEVKLGPLPADARLLSGPGGG